MPLPMTMISVSVGAIATMFFSATSANIINVLQLYDLRI
jgi:hypothetical protein